jgi:nucleotide-binding universal stress UspA family protein
VVALTATTARQPGRSGHEQPLAEDGDSWKAIVVAARRYDVDLVNKRQGWFSRLFSGSAAQDLVTHADWPVLLVSDEALARQTSTSRSDPATGLSPANVTMRSEDSDQP